jgi:hypothetical protein
MNLNTRRVMKPTSRLAPIGVSYPIAGHRWAEGHASSTEGAVFLALLAITALVAPVIWLV